MSLEGEIKVLQDNMKDLQGQLANAHKRISELIASRDTAFEDMKKEKEHAQLLNERLNKFDKEASELIQKKMDDIPDVLDSKPKNFSQPPQPGYRVREGEKWVKIGPDGNMEFEDIEIKD